MLGVSVPRREVERVAALVGCAAIKTPFVYLGVLVGGSMGRTTMWVDVEKKVSDRLSKWKLKTLSVGGRLTLLKSVLGSIPTYYLSLFKAPVGVIKRLEDMRSRFFRGVDGKEKKMAWIGWDKVCADRDKGGLGVGSYFALNRALLFKWIWRFKSNPRAMWVKVVKAIHGDEGLLGNNIVPKRTSVWRDIIVSAKDLLKKGIDLMGFCKRRIGNGMDTSFWKDIWIGDTCFMHRFGRLYNLENVKNVSVASKFMGSWDDSFRRMPMGGLEEVQMGDLENLMQGVMLTNNRDTWVWDLMSDGEFSVSSARRYIDGVVNGLTGSYTRWAKMVPIKVNVFVWKMMLNGLPTRFNMSKRGIDLESILCPVCGLKVEDIDHLFFDCDFVKEVVACIGRWWSISLPSDYSLPNWKSWFDDLRLQKPIKEVLQGVFFVTWWYIWRFRNDNIFGDTLPKKSVIFDDIVTQSFFWCNNRTRKKIDWNLWLLNPSLIQM